MKRIKDVAEIDATIEELPTVPPEGTIETVVKRGLLPRDILIYRAAMVFDPLQDRKRRMVHVHCTACAGETHLEYEKFQRGCPGSYVSDPFGFIDPADGNVKRSHSICVCPSCGKGMEAIHIGRFHEVYEMDRVFCVTVHNIRGHLAILSWTIGKYARKTGEIFCVSQMWEGSVIVGCVLSRVVGYVKNMSAISFYSKWKARVKYYDGISDVSRAEIMDFPKDLVESTDSSHCALYEYVNDRGLSGKDRYPTGYLKLWCRHPNVENLVRNGLSPYLNSLIEACGGTANGYEAANLRVTDVEKHINFKEVKPHRMLGVDKCEVQYAKKYGFKTIERCKQLRDEYGIRLTDEVFFEVNELGPDNFKYYFADTGFRYHRYKIPIVRMLNYLMRQKEEHKNCSSMIGLGYLRDYWDSVFLVYGRMEKNLLYPKNLVTAHDEILRLIKDKEDSVVNEGIMRRYEELSYMSFEDPSVGLLIRPVSSHAEIVSEGKILNHCVARYAKDVAEGKTCIFLIRDIEDPGVPYYTLEYHNGVVRQNRGKSNCDRTQRVIEFEKSWLAYLSTLQACRKGEVNGKQSGIIGA